jgi:Cu2+-containing amine oxidase
MEAGWYRYIAEYRFATDGTIRPRFGFGGVQDNCICITHHHHVYWRFDFDVVSPTNRVYQMERGRKFLQPITTEINRDKNIATNRRIVVQNSNGNEAYVLIPNVFDGTVSPFAVNDFWILRYKNVPGGTPVQNEIDDGVDAFVANPSVNINITPYVNGESLVNQDVVVWYGAHFDHTDGANAFNSLRSPKVLTGDHVVGPDLRPIRW